MDAATLVLEPLKRASTSSSRHTDDGSSPADAVAVDGSRCVLGRAGGDSVVAGVTTLNVSREQVALERCEGGWRATQRGMNPSCVIADDGVHVLRRGESRLLQDGDDVVLDGNSLMGRVRKQGGFCDGFRVRTRAPEPASLLAAKDAEIRELKRKLEEAARQPPRPTVIPRDETPPPAVAVRATVVGGADASVEARPLAGETVGDLRRSLAAATGLAPPFKVIFRQRVLDDDAATLEGVGLVEDAAVVVVAAPFRVRARIVGGSEVAVDAQRTHAVAALKAAIAGAAALTAPFTVIFRQRPLADDAATLADEGFEGDADVVVVVAPPAPRPARFRFAATNAAVDADARAGATVRDVLAATPGCAGHAASFGGRPLDPDARWADLGLAGGAVVDLAAAPAAPFAVTVRTAAGDVRVETAADDAVDAVVARVAGCAGLVFAGARLDGAAPLSHYNVQKGHVLLAVPAAAPADARRGLLDSSDDDDDGAAAAADAAAAAPAAAATAAVFPP